MPLPKHVGIYFDYFGYDVNSWIACEVCGVTSVDIHHIIPRSKFGSKRKDEQDNISNLIALCRDCHNQAHSHEISKETLFSIIANRK